MSEMKFKKELYSKVALIKAAYNYTDKFYIHLDADDNYYYVNLESKGDDDLDEQDFINEMLTQSVRHEVYQETKNIRELLLARAMSTSIITDENNDECLSDEEDNFKEDEILKDWFSTND